MRACVQCGLSIGATATFCQVCGATYEPAEAEAVATIQTGDGQSPDAVEPVVRQTPMAVLDSESVADVGADHEPVPVSTSDQEPVAAAPVAAPALEAPADDIESSGAPEAGEPGDEPAAECATETAQCTAETAKCAAEPAVEPAAEVMPEPAAGQEQSAEAELDRRLLGISALLQDAAGCEGSDPARAANLLQQAIIDCLEVTEDPLGHEEVRRDLLESFDRLSALLERQGVPDEALVVVDDAASLRLLEGGVVGRRHSEALRERREGLRRILFADSAQL